MQVSQETPCQIWIIRAVGKLIVSLHLTGWVRFRSLSLTHRPAENPTGVTMMLVSQGILNHAPPCSAVKNDK